MYEHKYKESIDEYIGNERLFNQQLKGRILNEIRSNKQRSGITSLFKKVIPVVIALLLVIGSGTFLYLSIVDKQEVSSPNEDLLLDLTKEDEHSSNMNLATIELDLLRETLNMSFRVVNAMINKDYEYLEAIIAPSVILDKKNNTITFGEINYERPLMTNFDYENFEFRGYTVDGDEVNIFLGVYNVSYYFTFVKGESEYGNYLWKSLLTN